MTTSLAHATLDSWEAQFAPYDSPTYQAVLQHITPADVVLDIGAGDLRLTRRIAKIARRVVAIELQPQLLRRQPPLPANLTVICGDARSVEWPGGITVAVLLMRHCTHFGLYANRLLAQGCNRLVTNARWGMGVEQVNLADAVPWREASAGWYACRCGQVGFIPAPPRHLTAANTERVSEVVHCPACAPE
ncbi:MAG: hypothetical protein Kow0031_03390 [Anaerolineae bacterium]